MKWLIDWCAYKGSANEFSRRSHAEAYEYIRRRDWRIDVRAEPDLG